jgi:hypothetical protein
MNFEEGKRGKNYFCELNSKTAATGGFAYASLATDKDPFQ